MKSNHKKLHSAVVAAFAKERKEPLGDIRIENKHGRVEAHIFHVLSADQIVEDFPQWPGLKTLGMSVSYRQVKGKQEELTYR
ncbi:MAG: ISAs1 family transposase, partial [Nitrosopumilaceae archaeon]|nr:ISAs1 family transposase [Nitrosopumilaceae archaeon]